jgi:hypothetical protein
MNLIALFMTKVMVRGISAYDAKLNKYADVKTNIKIHSCRQLIQFRHRPILKVSEYVAIKYKFSKINFVPRIV